MELKTMEKNSPSRKVNNRKITNHKKQDTNTSPPWEEIPNSNNQ
jgi:hypothetical protein